MTPIALIGETMIFLLLVMGGLAYMVVCLVRTHLAPPRALRQAITDPPLSPEPWGRLDDMQLTRLLRHAAGDK